MTDQDVCQYNYMAIYMDLMSITPRISGRLHGFYVNDLLAKHR